MEENSKITEKKMEHAQEQDENVCASSPMPSMLHGRFMTSLKP